VARKGSRNNSLVFLSGIYLSKKVRYVTPIEMEDKMISLTRNALTLCALTLAAPAMSQEVNVYSYRQPELIQPLMDAFTEETGIIVNVAFLKKGLIERLRAEGSRSPRRFSIHG